MLAIAIISKFLVDFKSTWLVEIVGMTVRVTRNLARMIESNLFKLDASEKDEDGFMECPRISLFTGPRVTTSGSSASVAPSSPISTTLAIPTSSKFVNDQKKPVMKPISASNPHSSTETAS